MKQLLPILQVEDDENDVLLLQHAFASAGITNPLRLAQDGQEAIDYFLALGNAAEGRNATPALVLLDLKLPRKSGLEVLQWMRQSSKVPWLPVIVFSSSLQRRDVEQAYAAGANSFVAKPASVARRLELARLIKSFWLDFNEPVPER